MDTKNIPLEIIAEILSNLPVKSLRRFSAVSKPWKAMISDEKFIRQHKSRASLPGRERIRILLSHSPRSLMPATTRLLSSLSSNRLDSDQPFFCPLINDVKFLVSCNDMWCMASQASIFVLNPSTGTYKKLPQPTIPFMITISSSQFTFRMSSDSTYGQFSFGMGFDSIADDYKILKLSIRSETELYSFRSNSWRKIDQPFPILEGRPPYSNAVFASNAFHWMAKSYNGTDYTIISFDLSTEKYERFVQPPFESTPVGGGEHVDLTVMRGKLCLYFNYHAAKRFVLWEMQEYGDGKSWTKIMDTSSDVWSLITPKRGKFAIIFITFKPLHLYHNGMILMKATNSKSEDSIIFMVHRDEPHVVNYSYNCGCTSGPLYVESLVSPATY